MSDPDWVPVDACTLPTADRPLRLAEFDRLFRTALRDVERRDASWMRLRLAVADGAEAQARDLAARESQCCSFFAFDVRRDGDDLVVDVRVPADRSDVLDGPARQARSARA